MLIDRLLYVISDRVVEPFPDPYPDPQGSEKFDRSESLTIVWIWSRGGNGEKNCFEV
jgi:hypothetical protein